MKTPIADFVRHYVQSGTARFHMPGHKGESFLGCETFDLTEIKGADDLFAPDGIIAQSEQNAADLFATGRTLYSAEGATLPVKAMLAIVAQNAPKSGKRVRILAARNAHKSFLHGCALLDLDVDWLYGKGSTHLCSCILDAEDVEAALRRADTPYAAVYVTSPDYLGQMQDVAALSAVCKRHGVPLLVDNAHGAYLAFSDPVCHPIALGATMCADSAHKTLPVLTGGAYLHIAKDAPPAFIEGARQAMALFASSSPSYLILQSLDLCNAYLSDDYTAKLADTCAAVEAVRTRLRAHGLRVLTGEPLKLVIEARAAGYTGTELADVLRQSRIEPEFADKDFLVLMCTPQNTAKELSLAEKALTALPLRAPNAQTVLPKTPPVKALSIHEAILSPTEALPVREALGRICAAPTVSCPPAVPIVISGERITAEAIALFEAYGIEYVDVVAN